MTDVDKLSGTEYESVQETDEVTNLRVGSCEVMRKDVTRYFATGMTPDYKDIIVHVRSKFPNPYQKVVVTTDMSLPATSLRELSIYVKGETDMYVDEVRGLTGAVYMPLEISEETAKESDFSLHEKILEYTQYYGILNFDIIVYGTNDELLQRFWDYVHEEVSVPYTFLFPLAFTKKIRMFEHGVDISVYSSKLEHASFSNDLTTSLLRSVMDDVSREVASGKTAIQCGNDSRTLYDKWLTMCALQENQLPPTYLKSYISEHVELNIAYPFEKLSFFERISFLSNLPENVGYIGQAHEFTCLFKVVKKVYPKPALAFNLKTKTFDDDLEKFDMESMRIFDYRKMFKGSPSFFPEEQKGISSVDSSDLAVDRQLSDIFTKMMEMSGMTTAYLTVRNTMMAQVFGDSYILYYTEPLGVAGMLYSEYFGQYPLVIKEEEFNHLIDAKVILAKQAKEKSSNMKSGVSDFTDIMVTASSTFKPAIPAFVLMCSVLASGYDNRLSYYDQRLRCDRLAVPIVTHLDSELQRKPTVFDYLSYVNVKKDKVSANVVSAFGTLNTCEGFGNRLPVSIDSFRGCKLL